MNVTAATPVHVFLVRFPFDGSRLGVELFGTSPEDVADVVCERIVGVHCAYRSELRELFIPALGGQGWAFRIDGVREDVRVVEVELAIRIRDARWIR